jgi:uncharacterized protein RhaS with RHS repeats
VGRVRTDATGAGAGFDGIPGVSDLSDVTAPTIGEATGYARTYSYDAAGRLTQVRDNTSNGYAETTSVCSVREVCPSKGAISGWKYPTRRGA